MITGAITCVCVYYSNASLSISLFFILSISQFFVLLALLVSTVTVSGGLVTLELKNRNRITNAYIFVSMYTQTQFQ